MEEAVADAETVLEIDFFKRITKNKGKSRLLKGKINAALEIVKRGNSKEIANAFQNIYNINLEPAKVMGEPLFIQIEPTTFCNLKCVMCLSPGPNRQKTHLKAKEFSNLLEKLRFVQKISLVGIGEPLLNPDLPVIIKTAKDRSIMIGIATNGILLDNDLAKNLLDSGIDWINISIDGVNSKTYEKIRGRDEFSTVCKNAEGLQRLLENYKGVGSGIWFTIQRENINELPEMPLLSKMLGFKNLYSQTTHSWGNQGWATKRGYMLDGRHADLLATIAKTRELAKREKISFFPLNIPKNKRRRYCKWPWRSCYISVEGLVTPCCMNGCDPNVINFGSIFEKQFGKIWNSQEYMNFRMQLKSYSPPEICSGCPSF